MRNCEELTKLPNIGPRPAENLGVETPEALRELGAAFLRVRAQVAPAACFRQLTALAGAELGIPEKTLTAEKKTKLRAFFDGL